MQIFMSKYITTQGHHFVGFVWPFRNCQVEMHSDGFSCNCKKQPRDKCNHIKSVEFGILGVNAKEYRIEPVRA